MCFVQVPLNLPFVGAVVFMGTGPFAGDLHWGRDVAPRPPFRAPQPRAARRMRGPGTAGGGGEREEGRGRRARASPRARAGAGARARGRVPAGCACAALPINRARRGGGAALQTGAGRWRRRSWGCWRCWRPVSGTGGTPHPKTSPGHPKTLLGLTPFPRPGFPSPPARTPRAPCGDLRPLGG